MEIAPSNTLYVNNINEKIKKNVLKKMLAMVFSQYGKVIQIVACKGLKLRGQAWVVFQDMSSATNALRGKQGFNFYGKPLKIQYAKQQSDILAKKEGTYVSKEKRKREYDDSDLDQQPSSKQKIGMNHILVAQHLPSECNQEMLHVLFSQCPGFQEVRLPPGGKGVAFIEFGDEIQAKMAQKQLNGFQISQTYQLQLNISS